MAAAPAPRGLAISSGDIESVGVGGLTFEFVAHPDDRRLLRQERLPASEAATVLQGWADYQAIDPIRRLGTVIDDDVALIYA